MINATFVTLLSFILFMGIAFRFGYRKSIAALDERIEEIKQSLDTAAHEKEMAHEALQAERYRQAEIVSEVDSILKHAEEEVSASKHHALHELEEMLESRQAANHLALDRLRIEAIDEIKSEVAFLTQKSMEEIISSFSKKQHELLNQHALDLIQTELAPHQPANGQEGDTNHKPFRSAS